jgi:hypothetical protein
VDEPPIACHIFTIIFWFGKCLLCCMVAHSSNMQDLSQHTIPRHLQDTTCHYLFAITPLFEALRQSHQYHALSRPTDSLLHTCTITAVWLPIAWTCKIHHCTQYRDPYRTLLYQYLLAIVLIFFDAQHQTHHYHTIATPTDSLPHTGTITATPEQLPHNARL